MEPKSEDNSRAPFQDNRDGEPSCQDNGREDVEGGKGRRLEALLLFLMSFQEGEGRGEVIKDGQAG